jgi:hypothetical protein
LSGSELVLTTLDSWQSSLLDLATVSDPYPASSYVGLVHDPASRRLAVGDSKNHVVFVLGYDGPRQPITRRGVVRTTASGKLAYDPVRKVLWQGDYGMPLDLGAF